MNMNSSKRNLFLLLLGFIISPISHASYAGSVTCHTGEDIPGPTHSGDSGGPLSVKGIIVKIIIGGDEDNNEPLILAPDKVNQVPAGIFHRLHVVMPDGAPAIGHYIRAAAGGKD